MTVPMGNEVNPLQQPQQQPEQAQAATAALLTLGSMRITDSWVYTPVGTFPLAGSNVTFFDQTRTTSKIPTWAIVLTIVTVWFFLIGLLFLLAKEEVTTGYVSVTVQHRDGRMHTEHIAVHSAAQRDQIIAQASWLQQAIAAATWRDSQG